MKCASDNNFGNYSSIKKLLDLPDRCINVVLAVENFGANIDI
jgi:hypothetical protein